MTHRVNSPELIAIAGSQVIDKWTSAEIEPLYRFAFEREYGIPIIAQYSSVVLHNYFRTCEVHLLHASTCVLDAIENVLGFESDAYESDEPRFCVTAFENGKKIIELHFDIMKTLGPNYNICVLAVEKYETVAQQLAGVAMASLDETVRKLILKPWR